MRTVFFVVFLDLLGFGIIIPILPYYAESFGASAFELGVIAVCYSGMQFLFSPVWGRVSDRIGRRPVLLTCIAGISVSFVILGFASSLLWLVVGRLLAGFFGANISAAAAYIADITPPDKRAKGMGLIGAAFGLGFLFGPAVGGYLSQWGYGTAAFVAAGLAALNFLYAIVNLREPKLSEEERSAHRHRFTWKMWLEIITHRETGTPILLFFLITMGIAQLETCFALYLLAQFGLDAVHAGMILALMAICMVAIQGGAIGSLVKQFGESTLVKVGALLMAVGVSSAMLVTTVHAFTVALMFQGVGYGLVTPSLQSLVSRGAKEGAQGATMGVHQSAGSMARIIGPLMAGLLFDALGRTVPFYVASLLFLVAASVAVVRSTSLQPRGAMTMEAT